MSDIKTLCYICGKVAVAVCKNCGGHVCKNHYNVDSGFCTSCMAGRKQGGKGGKILR